MFQNANVTKKVVKKAQKGESKAVPHMIGVMNLRSLGALLDLRESLPTPRERKCGFALSLSPQRRKQKPVSKMSRG
eukprot:6341534-Amphidinium_carterae.2